MILRFAGLTALLLVLGFTLGTAGALFLAAEPGRGLARSDWSALRFTLVQASLSAVISVVVAVPLARALVRQSFPGRSLVLTLLGAPFLLPVIVAVLGLLAVWGRSGLVSTGLLAIGAERIDIYGLWGVVLAHVFFNLPLVTRILVQGWMAIPAEQFKLAEQLQFSPADMFRHLEMQMLRQSLPGAFTLVFLLCMTSFAVALALGGGPRATTLELAIYQALRFDFDLAHAAMLAGVQFGLCCLVAAVAMFLSLGVDFGAGLGGPVRHKSLRSSQTLMDRTLIVAAVAFLGLPLLMVVVRGITGLIADLPDGMGPATLRSLGVALISALVSLGFALVLAAWLDRLRGPRRWGAEVIGYLGIAASPFVMGTGLFILLNPVISPFSVSLPVTAAVNAVISLPFSLRVLLPAFAQLRQSHGRLGDSLGMSGWSRFRLISWPVLRRPAGFATGLAAALSMGDLGVIALFAPTRGETLPLYIYSLMGAYRMEAAAGAALVLLVSSLALFWLFDRGGRLNAAV